MSRDYIVLESNMPIREAIEMLLEANVSGAPVVDKKGALVGMLSEGDLLWKVRLSPACSLQPLAPAN